MGGQHRPLLSLIRGTEGVREGEGGKVRGREGRREREGEKERERERAHST